MHICQPFSSLPIVFCEKRTPMAYYTYTAHITHFERKSNRPDISILTAIEIIPTTTLKHVFHDTTHEEVYVHIIILKVNA